MGQGETLNLPTSALTVGTNNELYRHRPKIERKINKEKRALLERSLKRVEG